MDEKRRDSMRVITSLLMLAVLGAITDVSAKMDADDAQKDTSRFMTGITGTMIDDRQWTHQSMLEYIKCQDLFMAIAERPRTDEFVRHSLEGLPFALKDIVSARLLREENGVYYLNFNFLTQKDQKLIYDVSEKYGQSLTKAFEAEWDSFQQILKANQQEQIPNEQLAYILLGLFSLDWDGGDLTREMGLRSGATHTDNDNLYTPWANENGDIVGLKELYWGSHNEYQVSDAFVLTTFGDHDALPRQGMPDLIWRTSIQVRNAEDDMKRLSSAAMRAALKQVYRQYGKVLFAAKNKRVTLQEILTLTGWPEKEAVSHVKFLVEIQALAEERTGYIAAIPVLDISDNDMVQAIRALGWQTMENWLSENYASIKADLSSVAATSQGVPFEVIFTQVWHYIFGLTNRDLVRAGMFADPYADERTYKGFIPAIWDKELKENFNIQ
jgi:hypothetical protein